MSYVMAAATEVAGVLKKGDAIILESTSPVGTTDAMRDLIARLRPDFRMPGQTSDIPDVAITYCPEWVLPGNIPAELTHNDRSIGEITPRCARNTLAFYKRFVRSTCITCRKSRWTEGWDRRFSKRRFAPPQLRFYRGLPCSARVRRLAISKGDVAFEVGS